jgi:hypothetical protein
MVLNPSGLPVSANFELAGANDEVVVPFEVVTSVREINVPHMFYSELEYVVAEDAPLTLKRKSDGLTLSSNSCQITYGLDGFSISCYETTVTKDGQSEVIHDTTPFNLLPDGSIVINTKNPRKF